MIHRARPFVITAGLLALQFSPVSVHPVVQATRQGRPVFRSSTAHVTLDVVVTDSKDRPIQDLTKAEFEVRQSGRPQVIDQFELVQTPLADRVIDIGASFDVSPVSNARPQPDARAFSFVIDEGSLLPEDIVPTKAVMRQFIRRLSQGDQVSTTYIGRSDLGQDFTHDAARLEASIDRFGEALGSGASFDDPSNPVKSGDGRAVVFVLRNIVMALGSAPETRRAIVLVSRGTYTEYDHWLWLAFYREAERRGVPVYTIDPSGIAAPELGLQLSMENQTPGSRQGLDRIRGRAQRVLREIAANTGGRALVNKGMVLESVDQIVGDNASYYIIGFTPDREPSEGKFQEVDVRVKRPGAKVRSRRGYVVPPKTGAFSSADALARNVEEGTPGGDLQMTADMAILGPVRSGWDTIVTIDVTLPPTGDDLGSDDRLSVFWIALSPDGKVLGSQSHGVSVGRDARVASIVERVTLSQNSKAFRVAVASTKRQLVGRVHLPIPEAALRPTGPVGSLIVSAEGRNDTSVTLLGDAGRAMPFAPTTLRQFETLNVLRLWSRVTALSVQRVSLMATAQDGREWPIEVSQVPRPESQAIDVIGELPLKGLTSGHYSVHLEVLLPGGVEVHRRAAFEIR